MRKTITLVLLALSGMFYAPNTFGQDTSKINHVSTEEDGDEPQKPAKKKPFKYNPQLGFEIGPNEGYFLNGGGGGGNCAAFAIVTRVAIATGLTSLFVSTGTTGIGGVGIFALDGPIGFTGRTGAVAPIAGLATGGGGGNLGYIGKVGKV